MRTSSWKPNYGDMLVCAALLRQVELDDYALPYQDVRDPWVSPAEAILSHSWDKTNAALRRCHAEMQAFFKENGYQIRAAVEA
ncbi:hypothetical protein O4J55_27325 [Paracoccus sp. PXZ]